MAEGVAASESPECRSRELRGNLSVTSRRQKEQTESKARLS